MGKIWSVIGCEISYTEWTEGHGKVGVTTSIDLAE